MKIVNIIGGLGNQMFQYAFAKELEKRRGEKIYIDTSWFSHYNLHNGFELERLFNCSFTEAPSSEVKKISTAPTSFCNRFRRKYLTKNTHLIDKVFSYNENVFQLKGDVYYEGCWQSEKYFASVVPLILSDFTFKIPLTQKNTELLTSMKEISVSIHIRRGDYLKSENLNVCSKTYYQNAIKKIMNLIGENSISSFYIFSDDIVWCKENIDTHQIPAVFIDWNTAQDSWQDMALMMSCTHNIIANSSFSWWAAYLNKNPRKIIIAPSIWNMRELRQNDPYYSYNFSDVVPQTWIRVST